MTEQTSQTSGATPHPKVGLLAIFWAYFVVGLTAFGMAILQKLKHTILKNRWLTEQEMNDGLAMVQLYPGPIIVNFTTYAGYRLRGALGALMATLGFITPSIVLIIVLAVAYFEGSSLPWVKPLFIGLEALVVGVVFNVTLEFGQRALKSGIHALVGLLAFIALIYKVNALVIVLATLALGALFLRPKPKATTQKKQKPEGNAPPAPKQSSRSAWVNIGIATALVLAAAAAAWAYGGEDGRMTLAFLKVGTVAFGGGLTILPLVQDIAVTAGHWITMRQFADGIALSQITPGSFLNIAAFIGYKVDGIWGALLASFGIYAPSFLWTLLFSEIYGHVRNNPAVRGALAGVLAGFVGMLAVVVLQLGRVSITGPAALTMAAAAFVAVRFFKIDLLWVMVGGLGIWWVAMLAGVV